MSGATLKRVAGLILNVPPSQPALNKLLKPSQPVSDGVLGRRFSPDLPIVDGVVLESEVQQHNTAHSSCPIWALYHLHRPYLSPSRNRHLSLIGGGDYRLQFDFPNDWRMMALTTGDEVLALHASGPELSAY